MDDGRNMIIEAPIIQGPLTERTIRAKPFGVAHCMVHGPIARGDTLAAFHCVAGTPHILALLSGGCLDRSWI
jgi:hypothetical protein